MLQRSSQDPTAAGCQQRQMLYAAVLEAHRQPREPRAPCDRALGGPTMPAQPLRALHAVACDADADAAPTTLSATAPLIVAFVRVRGSGVATRPAAALDQSMAFQVAFRAIRWDRSDLRPPLFAVRFPASRANRRQSIFPACLCRESKCRCGGARTMLRCHSAKRRQQVELEPQPISPDRSCHGIPILNTRRMPRNSAQSSKRGRPPEGATWRFDRSGSISALNLLLTYSFTPDQSDGAQDGSEVFSYGLGPGDAAVQDIHPCRLAQSGEVSNGVDLHEKAAATTSSDRTIRSCYGSALTMAGCGPEARGELRAVLRRSLSNADTESPRALCLADLSPNIT